MVKTRISPNHRESVTVYFGRLASYRHWFNVILFRDDSEKLKKKKKSQGLHICLFARYNSNACVLSASRSREGKSQALLLHSGTAGEAGFFFHPAE
jgi:hypothetical protein